MSEAEPKQPPYGEMPEGTYATYRDERNRLTDAESGYAKDFDKYVLTLSGGAIALSIAFLRDLVGHSSIRGAGMLIGAWFFLALAAGMVVFGLYLNPISQAQYRRILDEQAQQGGRCYWSRVAAAQSKCRLPKVILYLNFGSVFAFLLGLGLLLGFSYRSVATKGLGMNKPDNITILKGVSGDEISVLGGSPPAPGPVDRITVTPVPVPPQPASVPSGSQPATPPPTPGK